MRRGHQPCEIPSFAMFNPFRPSVLFDHPARVRAAIVLMGVWIVVNAFVYTSGR